MVDRSALREALRRTVPLAHFEAVAAALESRGLIKSETDEGRHFGYGGVARRFRVTTYMLTAKGKRRR